MRVICIAGLPGSGKTTLARSLLPVDGILLDDLNNQADLHHALQCKSTIIITDPYFCKSAVRLSIGKFLEKYGVTPEWIFFENSPVKCENNVLHRNDGRKVKDFIRILSGQYVVPETHEAHVIWQP